MIPLAFYVVWWLGWGHTAESHVSLENLEHLPGFVFNAAGAGLAALVGRNATGSSSPGQPPTIFLLFVALAALAIAAKVVRERRISREMAVALALALGFWIIAGLDRDHNRLATSNRYQYPSAVFIVVLLGAALQGVRIPRLAAIGVGAVAVIAVVGGISLLHDERAEWEGFNHYIRANLGALAVAGDGVAPDFHVPIPGTHLTFAEYHSAVSRFGSPAVDESQLVAEAGDPGLGIDDVLVGALGLRLSPVGSAAPTTGPACRLQVRPASPEAVTLTAARTIVHNAGRSRAHLFLLRFGRPLEAGVGSVGPGGTASLRIPPDRLPRPWRLEVGIGGPVLVKPAGAACEHPVHG